MNVVDSIKEDGPMLVEMAENTANDINSDTQSPVRAVQVVYYDRPNPQVAIANVVASAGATTNVSCVDSTTGAGVPGASVVAFTDFDEKEGASGKTDNNGDVFLGINSPTIERLYVYPPSGYWGGYQENLATGNTISVQLEPVDLAYKDCIRHYYGNSNFDSSVGVKVGIIDSGVGPHTDLNLDVPNCRNTVTGEPGNAYEDGGDHGTHVAGIVGSHGIAGSALRGVAHGVELVALRVFPSGGKASNYAILKAMIFAADAGCDIINLSLGGGPADAIVREAMDDAQHQGMLVIAASGNDGRAPVAFPAAYSKSIAVSALGVDGTFPPGSLEAGDVLRPPVSAANPTEFIASFSNIGIEINCTGPGVGALSTLPNNGFGPMSGTSMAAPAVAGAAACLLSQNTNIYNMPRDAARAEALRNLLLNNCDKRGFGGQFEGIGLPDPALV